MSSRKKGLYIVLVGIVILALKLSFNTGLNVYPEYETDYKVGSEFQAYTINYNYGATRFSGEEFSLDVFYTGLRIDVLSNIIGYILIIIGTLKLKDVSRVFVLPRLVACIGLILDIIIKVLPFLFNGYKLCYISLFIGIVELFAAISVSYLFVYGVSSVLSDIAFKAERTNIGNCHFGMVTLMLVVAFTSWISTGGSLLGGICSLFCALVIGLMIYNIAKVDDYIVKEKCL